MADEIEIYIRLSGGRNFYISMFPVLYASDSFTTS